MLHAGDIIELQGQRMEVERVNECSATVRPVEKVRVSGKTLFGRAFEFFRARQAFDISPNSEVPIVERLQEKGAQPATGRARTNSCSSTGGTLAAQGPGVEHGRNA